MADYIKHLEEPYDANQSRWPSPPDEGGELPSAEDLLSDLEGFLRDRQRDDGLPAGYCPAKHSCSWSPNPLVRFDARNGWYCSRKLLHHGRSGTIHLGKECMLIIPRASPTVSVGVSEPSSPKC